MTEYKANDPKSLSDFSFRLSELNNKQRRWFAASITNAGLFNFPDDINDLFDMMSGLSNMEKEDLIVASFAVVDQEEADNIYEGIQDHIINGEDQTQGSDAVGGWNQQELTLAAAILEYAETV